MDGVAPERTEPPLEAQTRFWDQWNLSRLSSTSRDSFQREQQDCARRAAERLAGSVSGERPLRILDFGCGTGWLGASLTDLGAVTGVDLSPAAVEHGAQEFPDVQLIAGSFSDTPVAGPFDLVISSDVIAHVADQDAYIARAAELLRPGGALLMMTQNGFVWRRSSGLNPVGEGQIRNWPSLKDLRAMLAAHGFTDIRISSIQPAGDRGVLRVVNSRALRGGFKLVGLGGFWKSALERLRVGRDFTIEARRS